MILVKNKLKKIKTSDDDDMLHYLKYSHLERNNNDDEFDFLDARQSLASIRDDTEYENKATQFPDIKNKSTQTNFKIMEDKETDTYDELHEIIGAHFLKGYSEKIKSEAPLRGNFKSQVNSIPYRHQSKESSSSSSSSDSDFLSRNLKRGFRLAEFALNSAMMGVNLTMSIADAVAEATLNNNTNNDEDENNNQVPEYVTSNTAHGHNNHAIAISVNSQFNNTDEVISVDSSPPLTVSSATPPQTVQSSSASSASLAPTSPQSIPVPTTPQSSRSSSKSSSIHSPHKKHK